MGEALIRVLPWDSEHFGFPIGRVDAPPLRANDVERALLEAEQHALRCLYLLAEASEVAAWRAAARNGFEPIDMRLEFDKTLDGASDGEGELANEGDRESIAAIAAGLFTDSRFFRDERFPRHRSEALFRQWAMLGFDDDAHFNVVARRDDRVAAFITCGVSANETGSIDLVGVARDARGGGIGHRLLARAEKELMDRGCTRVTVATQSSNLAAQRLYERAGFVSRRAALWLHRWWS